MINKTAVNILCALLLFSATLSAQGIQFNKVQIITAQVAPHFYLLTGSPNVDSGHPEGAGGRVGVFTGPEGIVMVDAQYAPLTGKILAAVKHFNDGSVRFLINTHEHPDHTGGNPNFAHLGATIISSEKVRDELSLPFPPKIAAVIGDAASITDSLRLPVITCMPNTIYKMHINGETIALIALAPAHTDGDMLVFFEHENVMMIGDIYRNYGYPFIDRTHGGSFSGMLAALDTVMQLSNDHTIIVPGHGSVITKTDIPAYATMVMTIRQKISQMIEAGKSRDQVLTAKLTASYDAKISGGTDVLPAGLGTVADRFVGSLYDELISTKNKN